MKRTLYAILVGVTLILAIGNLLLWQDDQHWRDQIIRQRMRLDKLEQRLSVTEQQIAGIGSVAHRHVEQPPPQAGK